MSRTKKIIFKSINTERIHSEGMADRRSRCQVHKGTLTSSDFSGTLRNFTERNEDVPSTSVSWCQDLMAEERRALLCGQVVNGSRCCGGGAPGRPAVRLSRLKARSSSRSSSVRRLDLGCLQISSFARFGGGRAYTLSFIPRQIKRIFT